MSEEDKISGKEFMGILGGNVGTLGGELENLGSTFGNEVYQKLGKSPGEIVGKSLEAIDPVNAPQLYGLSEEEVDDYKLLTEVSKYGIHDPWNPEHFYDYASAVSAGDLPDSTGKWLSKYKHDLHPERFLKGGEGTDYPDMEWYDTKHDRPALQLDKVKADMLRTEYSDSIGVVPNTSERASTLMDKIIGGANDGS